MIIHQELAAGRWFKLPLVEQLANIGSDVERTIQWKKKGNPEYSQKALERALDLIYLTVADKKNSKRLKEILRMKELLLDYFCADNIYGSTDKFWQDYFLYFNYLVAAKKGYI